MPTLARWWMLTPASTTTLGHLGNFLGNFLKKNKKY